ncbi:MAG TPA: metalloregulator ArsR/SmtB family transcription factor [Candidatus Acidoferrales bacterium]|nr:metalloregulator ArsR/SmtB family transcription factor [Candidatus Acidoferrales bacterium]
MRRTPSSADPDVAALAAVIADPTRCAMLYALLGGGEACASELAFRAGASPQAASSHLGKLVGAGFLSVRSDGRQKVFRMASPDVARAMESLAAIAKPARIRALGQHEALQRMREARSCYDHLAGRIGVAVRDRLVEKGYLTMESGRLETTAAGDAFFESLEIDVRAIRGGRRVFARACVDWTERRPHVAGALGAAMLTRFIAARWFARGAIDRSLRVTPEGRNALERFFGIAGPVRS